MFDAFLTSTAVVALAEIGDKTQLLAIILATRFKKPVPIILGILVATLANHALAATAGYWVSDFLSGAWFKWAIAISFIAMAAWALMIRRISSVSVKPLAASHRFSPRSRMMRSRRTVRSSTV